MCSAARQVSYEKQIAIIDRIMKRVIEYCKVTRRACVSAPACPPPASVLLPARLSPLLVQEVKDVPNDNIELLPGAPPTITAMPACCTFAPS